MTSFPTMQIVQQSLSIDPAGSRHLLSPSAGFLKLVDTSAGGVLDFGQVNTTGSGAISDTLLVYARVSNFGSASGVFNMRFFWYNTSSFTTGTYRFLERKTLPFIMSLRLDSGATNTPTVAPTTTNLIGTDSPTWPAGQPTIRGTGDSDVTEYVYLALEIANNVPVGTKGGAGAGSFRGRILFDYS